jgi:hypothetical protein
MRPEQPYGLTLNNRAFASNPGRMTVNPLRYAVSYPLFPILWGVIPLFLLVLGIVHPIFFVGAAVMGAFYVLYWVRVFNHFGCGCVNPSMIVDAERGLVATFTDLTCIPPNRAPVIKIQREPMNRLLFPCQNGQPLASVALYRGTGNSAHWDNFYPRLVECATADPAVIQQTLQSIPQEEWNALHVGLSRLPRPFEPGLYMLDPETMPEY